MTESWRDRLRAVSSAQARYLWALVVLGLFYYAVDRSLTKSASFELSVPVLDLPLPAAPVAYSGPGVLFFLLLVVLGSMRAYATAEKKSSTSETPSEAIDTTPNAIDLAVYTTDRSPQWLLRILRLTYPLFLSLFAFEAAWLLMHLFQARESSPSMWLFRLVGAALGVLASLLLLRFWWSVLRPAATKSAA